MDTPTPQPSALNFLRLYIKAASELRMHAGTLCQLILLQLIAPLLMAISPQLVASLAGSDFTGVYDLRSLLTNQIDITVYLPGLQLAYNLTFIRIIALFLFLSCLLVPAVDLAVEWYCSRAGNKITRELKRTIYRNAIANFGAGKRLTLGELRYGLAYHADTLTNLITIRLVSYLRAFWSVAIALTVLYQSSSLAVTAAVLLWSVFFSWFIPQHFGTRFAWSALNKIHRCSEAALEMNQQYEELLTELIDTIPTTASLGAGEMMAKRMDALVADLNQNDLSMIVANKRVSIPSQVSSSAIFIGLITAILRGITSPGVLVNVFAFSQRLNEEINMLCGNYITEFEMYPGSRAALLSLLRFQTPDATPHDILKEPFSGIKLEDVSYVADVDGEQRPILTHVDCEISKGRFIGVTGPSGNGKSTLLRVIAGDLPLSSGAIIIDEKRYHANSYDIQLECTILAQFAKYYKMSVKENILAGVESPSMPVEEALRRAGFHFHTSDELEQFLNRQLDPYAVGGDGLSGGERKRLFFARALVRKPKKIVLVDELDSGLPSSQRKVIFESLRQWVLDTGSTCLAVSHYPDDLPSDLNLFIKNGTCVASGAHRDLLATCEDYREVFG